MTWIAAVNISWASSSVAATQSIAGTGARPSLNARTHGRGYRPLPDRSTAHTSVSVQRTNWWVTTFNTFDFPDPVWPTSTPQAKRRWIVAGLPSEWNPTTSGSLMDSGLVSAGRWWVSAITLRVATWTANFRRPPEVAMTS